MYPAYIREHQDGVTLKVKVIPNSSKNSIGADAQDRLIAKLKAPPVEGKANKELVRFLAKKLGTPQSAITILQGKSSKEKVLLIAGMDRASVLERMGLGDTEIP